MMAQPDLGRWSGWSYRAICREVIYSVEKRLDQAQQSFWIFLQSMLAQPDLGRW
jgi:hypothetical protein